MSKKTIPEREDEIDQAKRDFMHSLESLIKLKNQAAEKELIQDGVNEVHEKACWFFHLFERSINEYGLYTTS